MLSFSMSSESQNSKAPNSSQASNNEFIAQARKRYYRPEEQGLVSFACDVKMDWDSVPAVMLIPAEITGRTPLEVTKLRMSMGFNGPKVQHEYANNTPALMVPVYDKFFDWLSNTLQGFMETWAPKAMNGPIPPEYGILGVTPTPEGYRLQVKAPGDQQVELLVNRDFLITEILTQGSGQKIDEHLGFTASPQGLLFTHNKGASTGGPNPVRIQYDIDYQTISGFALPYQVHLQVNDNMNMKFSLENCSVVRGVVAQVRASK
jgi:hypothetical protein